MLRVVMTAIGSTLGTACFFRYGDTNDPFLFAFGLVNLACVLYWVTVHVD